MSLMNYIYGAFFHFMEKSSINSSSFGSTERKKKVPWFWNDMSVSKWLQNIFIFGWSNTFIQYNFYAALFSLELVPFFFTLPLSY